ncbi:redoxin domain-containing protein [Demequina lutea]|uniref:Cytochrome oxidase Cu insertion factor (SCO1/SenC/PrrC family)/thiol-disulfide isomerase/thioredoxin n=1 Tax=Demequina lutea TaxID=431489 RepID=A0A7Y9ZAU6_9MICO|nr:redoxin domain-containing protein [Demequina lutea]NYI41405.1 cytochrome oxidase Cu insertion factor (SCO1/SenC/PrrC family)/thiol-disulfide isomerase/thioredoxin [Demequina lutea]
MTEKPRPDAPPTSRGTAVVWASAGFIVVAAVALIVAIGLPHSSAASDPMVEPGINAAAADLLQLDVLPPPAYAAPAFTLTDQNGQPVSLSQYRGKSVVLTFGDDECTDLCTLLAQDIVVADKDLGAAAQNVVFLGVNVNPFHVAVSDVAAWSDQHGLHGSSNWEFVTGSTTQLAQVADSYHVSVNADPATQSVGHGVEMFFIDPNGQEVGIGQFGTRSASTALYAHAMAQMAVDLLPPGSRTPVAGPTESSAAVAATLNAPAPALTLPVLGDTSTKASIAGTPGSYTVLNFWASTCSACVQEMPALEKAHQALGNSVAFVGVDIADPTGAAAAFARTSGVTYPLVVDANGTASGTYRVPGLPFTAIIGPDGTLLVRHAGTLTAEQLEYIVQTLQQN